MVPLLLEYLKEADLSAMDHSSRRCYYQIRLLNACLFDDGSPKHAASALYDWIMQRSLITVVDSENKREWFSQIVSQMYFRKVEEFTERLLTNQEELSGVATQLFSSCCGNEISISGEWMAVNATAVSIVVGRHCFSIDFLDGTLATEKGAISIAEFPSFIKNVDFKNLFQGEVKNL